MALECSTERMSIVEVSLINNLKHSWWSVSTKKMGNGCVLCGVVVRLKG